MGWSIGYDHKNKRDIGYGVPAECDHHDCNAKIDRGLSYVCGGAPGGGEHGCGLHFCDAHLEYKKLPHDEYVQLCEKCIADKAPFVGKPDLKEWVEWKLTDDSWQQWRDENADEVANLKAIHGL